MAPRAGLDREIVIQAAAELADRDGLDKLSIATLARALGVKAPSLYNHVDGLPGLQRALALRGIQALTDRLLRAGVGKSGPEALRALAHAYRCFILEHPGLYAATVRSPYGQEPPDPELDRAAREPVEVVLAALAAYNFDKTEALHAVRGLRSLVHGFATLELAGGFGIPLSVEESFNDLVERYLQGLGGK